MMWLKNYLENYVNGPVEITKPNMKFGDYSTNVLFKNQLKADETMAFLLKHELIEDVQLVKGYLNIYITSDLKIYDGALSSDHFRIKMIHHRLKVEGHTKGLINDYWKPLVKKVNEVNHCLDGGYQLDAEDVIDVFEKLDRGYVYRFENDETLGGIYLLFNQLLMVLGRMEHENNL